MTPDAAKIIENAKLARSFNICAGEADIPAPLLIRAAVAYARMVQQGWIAPIKDDLDLPHAIVTIAANYADYPPSTVHRRKLFATPLGPDDEPEPEAVPVDPRQMSLIADPVAERVASIVAHHRAEADRFDRAADDFDKIGNADAADRCRVRAGHSRTLAAQIERSDDLLERTGATPTPADPRPWQRGDLVLVDGDKEGSIKSVNGNVAQVALWDRAPAVVNVSRLSPLEQPKTAPAGTAEPEEDPEVGALIKEHEREQRAALLDASDPDIAAIAVIPERIGTQARETILAAAERFKDGETEAHWAVGYLQGQITLHPDGNPGDRDTVRMSGEQFAGLLGQCHQNGAMMAISAVGKMVTGDEP